MHQGCGDHAPFQRSGCTICAVKWHRFRRRIQLNGQFRPGPAYCGLSRTIPVIDLNAVQSDGKDWIRMFSNNLISAVLLSAEAFHQLSFRRPLKILQVRCFPQQGWTAVYPVCPRCGVTMEREYQHFCDRCGQKLDWSIFSRGFSQD